MAVLDDLRRLGGCAGGVAIYNAAKASAIAANVSRQRRHLRTETIDRVQPVFPQLDLGRVSFFINATLPPNWFTSADNVEGMTFGYDVYFKSSGYQNDDSKLDVLVHELAHVDQVRRRGDSERDFACDYGKEYLQAGNYEGNVLEVEARAYADIARDTSLIWYRHDGRADGSPAWANAGKGMAVGTGWRFPQVFSAEGCLIYAQCKDGRLLWYKHDGQGSGSATWTNAGQARQAGSGWTFRHTFAGAGGVIYGVNDAHELYWYKHDGRADGSPTWANGGAGKRVGTGWAFRHVFAGADGVIYGVNDAHELYWYKHDGRADGSPTWANGGAGKRVGTGWAFRHVFAGADGVIYGVNDALELYWYRHDGRADGSPTWSNAGAGKRVGTGWAFRHILAGASGVIYGAKGI
jgi:hypothetical protein